MFSRVHALGLERRDDTADLLEWLEEDPEDQLVIEELEQRISEEESIVTANPDPFRATTPSNANAFAGSLRVGRIVQTGQPFALDTSQVTQHGIVCGRTRGGKTYALRVLLHELLTHHPSVKVLIIERKRQFTDIARAFGFDVATLKTFRINPLHPPYGVPHHIWASSLTQTMVDHLDILTASSSLILSTCMRLYQEWGVLGQWDRPHPNLRDLYGRLMALRFATVSHTARYQESASNRLAHILNSYPGVFERDHGFDVSSLSTRSMLLLMHDMPNLTMQNFLASIITSQVFLHRMVVVGERPGLELLLVMDEATPFFRRQDELREKPSYIGTVISQAASFSVGVLATSQFVSDLSHSLLGNAATKILVGGFERGDDVRALLSARPHTREQEEVVNGERRVGHAFISDPRHTHFIEVQIDDRPDLPRPMTDAEVAQAAEDTARRLGWTQPDRERPRPQATPPAKQAAQPEARRERPSKKPPPTGPEARTEGEPAPIADPVAAGVELPPKRDREVLADMAKTPFETVAKRAGRLKMPQSGLTAMVKAIESRGEVVIHRVHGKSGRPADLYEVTEAGYRAIGETKPPAVGKGGFLHQFYQQRVSAHLSNGGYRVTIEGRADGKCIDVVGVSGEGVTIGVEIELNVETSQSFLRNLQVDLGTERIQRVLVLVPTRAELKLVQKAVRATPDLHIHASRIDVDLIGKYMDNAK